MSLINILTGGNASYWDIVTDNKSNHAYSYKIEKNGACTYYFYNRDGQRIHFDDEDNIRPNSWQVYGDSILEIRGLKRKILNFSEDKIVLQNFNDSENIILIRSTQQ